MGEIAMEYKNVVVKTYQTTYFMSITVGDIEVLKRLRNGELDSYTIRNIYGGVYTIYGPHIENIYVSVDEGVIK
jgi:hypothetical protein